MSAKRWLIAAIAVAVLTSCGKTYDPKDPANGTCLEQLKVFDYKGHKAWKTINGRYIKVGSIGPQCGKLDDKAKTNEYVTGGGIGWAWFNGKLYDKLTEIHPFLPKNKDGFPDTSNIGSVNLYLNLSGTHPPKYEPIIDWWYEPALPHKLYPIDLLPNWGLKQPDPERGQGLLKTKTPYYAVRGTKNLVTGRPFINMYCSMKSESDDPLAYLDIQKELTRTVSRIDYLSGNTCRGWITSSDGTLGAMIDTPSILVPEIDKVFNAVSQAMSGIVIE